MYKNLDECLNQIYKLSAVNIEPMGNTGAVIAHLQGVSSSTSGLTQAEHHANAAMIESQVSDCLNSKLLVAVVECEYGKYDNLHYLANALVAHNICDDAVFATDMLRHIYSLGKLPRRIWIMDKYDLPNMTFTRRRDKIKTTWQIGNSKHGLNCKPHLSRKELFRLPEKVILCL